MTIPDVTPSGQSFSAGGAATAAASALTPTITAYQAVATNAGIGYSTGDNIRQLQLYSGLGALVSTSWINVTNGGAIITTPVAAEIAPLSTAEFTGSEAYFMAMAVSPGIAKFDILHRTILRSGGSTTPIWDNLTQNTIGVVAPAVGAYVPWTGDKPENRPVISYQNLTANIGTLYAITVPANAIAVNIAVEGGQIRIQADGTPADASKGQKWSAGGIVTLVGKSVSQLSVFALTTGQISVEYIG